MARGHKPGVTAKHTCCAGDTWYVDLAEAEIERTLGVDIKQDVVTCAVPFGGALFLNNSIPHRSLQNYSDKIRWSLDLRWQHPNKSNGFYVSDCLIMLNITSLYQGLPSQLFLQPRKKKLFFHPCFLSTAAKKSASPSQLFSLHSFFCSRGKKRLFPPRFFFIAAKKGCEEWPGYEATISLPPVNTPCLHLITYPQGLKDCVVMRKAGVPDYPIDWEGFNTVDRTKLQMNDMGRWDDDSFDTTIHGPWMKR